MKVVNLILTYLFATVFLILGVGNYFFHFMPAPKPPTEVAGKFAGILYASQYMLVVKFFELAGALMIALNFRRALGWAIMLPLTINIALFEVLLAKQPGIGIALLIINLYMILFVHREKFRTLLQS